MTAELGYAFGAVQHRVRDLETSLRWYHDVLGLEPFAKEDFDPLNTFAAFAIGATPLALWQAQPGEELEITGTVGTTYVNLLTDDLEGMRAKLMERGAKLTQTLEHGRFRWFCTFDPDGNRIEFAQVMDGEPSG